jgi:hypothetical protein
VQPSPRTAVSLDAAAVLAFAALGALSHEGSAAGAFLRTGLPFLAGWFAAALALRLYDRPSPWRLAAASAAGTALGLALRSLVDTPAPAFVAVSFGTLLVLTAGWRLAYLVAGRWRSRTV